MGTKTISFSFDVKSINAAVKELSSYMDEFKRKLDELIRRLTEEGKEIAQLQVLTLGAFDTGELADSIQGYYSPSLRAGFIRAGAWYAVYVEYGTGVVGASSPHPMPGGWAYDVNSHGESGWVYMSDRDNQFHWTKGQPSSPFMYNTLRELERIAARVASEVFDKG